MSLLLTFFVLLLSMATFDKKRVELAIGSLEGSLSVLEEGRETEIHTPSPIRALPLQQDEDAPETVNVFASVVTEYNEMTRVANGPSVKFDEAEEGFTLQIPSELLFDSGSANLNNQDGILFLKRLAMEIVNLPNDMSLKVTGHTDNVALSGTGRFQDNWQLSVARGISVVRELVTNRVNPARLQSCGAGEFKPVATNSTPDGRALNRRVELHFFSLKSSEEGRAEQFIQGLQQL